MSADSAPGQRNPLELALFKDLAADLSQVGRRIDVPTKSGLVSGGGFAIVFPSSTVCPNEARPEIAGLTFKLRNGRSLQHNTLTLERWRFPRLSEPDVLSAGELKRETSRHGVVLFEDGQLFPTEELVTEVVPQENPFTPVGKNRIPITVFPASGTPRDFLEEMAQLWRTKGKNPKPKANSSIEQTSII